MGNLSGTSQETPPLPLLRIQKVMPTIKATDLPFNQLLGIRPAPAGAEHLLEMPLSSALLNHLGTVHAAAQFGLAEAASAECLQRYFDRMAGDVHAVVRSVEVKYRKPAITDLWAFGCPDDATRLEFPPEFARRGRGFAMILVDLKDSAGTLSFHGQFQWFLSRAAPPTAPTA